MNGPRRFLGFMLYIFMGFPLLLGGLTLASLKPFFSDPKTARTLVTDPRFARLLEAPELPGMAPETISVGGLSLDGGDAVRAAQASIPAAELASLAGGTIDAAVAAASSGALGPAGEGFELDLRPYKKLVLSRADALAAAYVKEASDTPDSLAAAAGLPPGTKVPAIAAEKAVARAVRKGVEASPDAYRPEGADLARIKPVEVAGGMAAGSVGLIVAGLGFSLGSALVSERRWGRRFSRLGSRLVLPGAIVLGVGLLSRLSVPGIAAGAIAKEGAAAFPALVDYVRFVVSSIGNGFLVAGLASVGTGVALSTLRRAIPALDGEDGDEE